MTTTRKAPRQQRSRATVAVVLEAAAQLFAADGYHGTSTNHIAERAGVSIGSVYQYFANKDEILLALADQHIGEVVETLRPEMDRIARVDPGLQETVAALVHAVARLHLDQPALHRLLFDATPRTPELVQRFRAMERQFAGALAVHLQRLGVGGSDPPLRALLVVQGIEAQIHGAMLDGGAGVDHQVTVTAIVDLWVAALDGQRVLGAAPGVAPSTPGGAREG